MLKIVFAAIAVLTALSYIFASVAGDGAGEAPAESENGYASENAHAA